MQDKDDPELGVCAEIVSYFLRHPRVADDLEGIARWRLAEERVQRCIEDTRGALVTLVTREILIEESAPASRRVYRLNPQKRAEAARFLNKFDARRRAGS